MRIKVGVVLAIVASALLAVVSVNQRSTADQRSAATSAVDQQKCPEPGAPIAIQSIWVSSNPVRMGESVTGMVHATCNVAAVTAQIGTYRIGVPKVAPGVFKTTVHVPFVVWPGHFNVVVTAIRTDGFSIHTDFPIEVRW